MAANRTVLENGYTFLFKVAGDSNTIKLNYVCNPFGEQVQWDDIECYECSVTRDVYALIDDFSFNLSELTDRALDSAYGIN